jgi:hypothetical protein
MLENYNKENAVGITFLHFAFFSVRPKNCPNPQLFVFYILGAAAPDPITVRQATWCPKPPSGHNHKFSEITVRNLS